jgi:hypothetical protein
MVVTLCRRAVPKLWHAFPFLGLRPVGAFSSSIFLVALWFPPILRARNFVIQMVENQIFLKY